MLAQNEVCHYSLSENQGLTIKFFMWKAFQKVSEVQLGVLLVIFLLINSGENCKIMCTCAQSYPSNKTEICIALYKGSWK